MDRQIVLLTGGSTGIGLEIALQLMNKNARVYSASRRPGNHQKSDSGEGEIIPVQLDINNEADTASLVDRILKENGKLDVVICNAGNGIAGAVEDTSIDEVRFQMETNFFGAVKTIQACLPLFRKQGKGKIIVTSSIAAIVPIPYQAFYSAGKSALSTFLQALALEVKPFGIQCCAVLPGDTKTDFTSSRKQTEASQENGSVYSVRMKKAIRKMEEDEKNGMKASFVARKIVNQVFRKRMKPIVIPGIQYKLIYSLFNVLPVRWRMWAVGKLY